MVSKKDVEISVGLANIPDALKKILFEIIQVIPENRHSECHSECGHKKCAMFVEVKK